MGRNMSIFKDWSLLWTSDCSCNLTCVGHSMCCKEYWLHRKGAYLPMMLPHCHNNMPRGECSRRLSTSANRTSDPHRVTCPWSNPHLWSEDDLLTRGTRKHGNGHERECVFGQNLVGPGWVGNMRIFRGRQQYSGFGTNERYFVWNTFFKEQHVFHTEEIPLKWWYWHSP